MLDVPDVNSRGKMYEDDLAHYYPNEYAAGWAMQKLSSMMRRGRHFAAARRRERALQGEGDSATTGRIDTRERSSTGATMCRSSFLLLPPPPLPPFPAVTPTSCSSRGDDVGQTTVPSARRVGF